MSVPLPLLVSAPVLAAEFPDMVKMVPLVRTLMPLVVPFCAVNPRSVATLAPV